MPYGAIVTASTFAVALAVMYAVNAMGILRVEREGESYGLDLHEHGVPAYPYTTEKPVMVLGAKYRWSRAAGLL